VSWKYLIFFPQIFDGCPGDVMGVLDIFDILPQIFGGCLGDI